MKRDFDLIRALLLQFEAKGNSAVVDMPEVEGYSNELVAYHCRLLYDAGFLRCEPVKSSTSDRVIRVLPFELTWEGQEFLAKIRADSAWGKIKAQAKAKSLTLSFTVVSEIAKRMVVQLLNGIA